MKRRVVASAIVLLLAPAVATAAPPPRGADPAAAQVLFYEGRALMKDGRYAEACPKLQESLRLDPGIGTEFNLADCNEHLGKIATAWAGFRSAAGHATHEEQPRRAAIAQKRAGALEARLPKLVIDVEATHPGLEVRRDGVLVGAPAWGTAIPVDPGTHTVTATAPGYAPWNKSVAVAEGKTAKVEIPRELPPARAAEDAAPAAAATSAPVMTTRAELGEPTTFPPPEGEHRGDAQRTLGWVALGAGAIGLGVGAAFGLRSMSKRDASRAHCQGDVCDAVGANDRSDAIRSGNVATVATIAGGAALAGGLLLFLTAPKESDYGRSALRAAPRVGQSGGGIVVQGEF